MRSSQGSQWRSILMLILSSIGVFLSFGIAALLVFSGVTTLLGASLPAAQTLSMFSLAWAAGFGGLLCLPSAVFSLLDLLGKPVQVPQIKHRYLAATVLMLLWPLLVLLFRALETKEFAWLVLPPILILAAIIPIWWIVETGSRTIPLTTEQRTWNVVSFSLVATMPFILVVEVVALLVLLMPLVVWISSQPELVNQLTYFVELLQNPAANPALIESLIQDWISSPQVILSVLLIASGIIPLIEELFKPLALWFLAGRELTPEQGFTAGLIAGACFALWENLSALANAGDGSGTIILVGRVGTALLHSVNTGLIGWGMASAWHDRKHIVRLVWTYLLAVLLHGLWNMFGLVSGLAPTVGASFANTRLGEQIGQASSILLGVIIVINLVILFVMNARLRKSSLQRVLARIPQNLNQPVVGETTPQSEGMKFEGGELNPRSEE